MWIHLNNNTNIYILLYLLNMSNQQPKFFILDDMLLDFNSFIPKVWPSNPTHTFLTGGSQPGERTWAVTCALVTLASVCTLTHERTAWTIKPAVTHWERERRWKLKFEVRIVRVCIKMFVCTFLAVFSCLSRWTETLSSGRITGRPITLTEFCTITPKMPSVTTCHTNTQSERPSNCTYVHAA